MSVQIDRSKIFNRTNVLFWGGLIFAVTQLTLPIFASLIDLQLRAVHIILGISLASLAFPYGKSKEEQTKISLWDLFLKITDLTNSLIFNLKNRNKKKLKL